MANEVLKNKPMPTIGVDNYTIFKLTADGKGTGIATYDKAVRIPGTVEIAPTDNGGTDVFEADNEAYYIESYI